MLSSLSSLLLKRISFSIGNEIVPSKIYPYPKWYRNQTVAAVYSLFNHRSFSSSDGNDDGINRKNNDQPLKNMDDSPSKKSVGVEGGDESAKVAIELENGPKTEPKESPSDKKESLSSDKIDNSNFESSETSIVPAGPRPENFPKVLAVPLTRRPLFPGFYLPVDVRNKKLADALYELKKQGTPYVGAFLLKNTKVFPNRDSNTFSNAMPDSSASKTLDTLHGAELYQNLNEFGTFAQVTQVVKSLDGESAQVLLMGHRRVRSTGIVDEDLLTVSVDYLKDNPYNPHSDILKATTMEVVSTMKDLMRLNPLYKEHIAMFVQHVGEFNASRMADFGAALTTADESNLQSVLEELDVDKRLHQTLMLLKKELELSRIQATIAKGVEEKISGDQRRYLLNEQLKAIKKELGLEKDDKTALIGKFRDKMEPCKNAVPANVKQVIEDEILKLQGLETSSNEFNVTRNYLDWLTSIPWGQYSEENFDVYRAQTILDSDHYGLADVKERILEFIAVGRLRGSAQGKIICLVGPPGVGKTSIGKSIASALNRKFHRFSVGGLSDVAEIKGHRRTYVGAMPGKVVQCLKSVGTSNPLVLIDEIDKLGRGHAGDPASALLELLDPEQNSSFVDHYLDVPVDLSKVLFVCTANVLDTIPGPLLDRMEVIRLVGYITDEKMHIAKNYLHPTSLKNSGVDSQQIEITDGAFHSLIETYCREAGVRNLQKHIEKIHRKVALKLVRKEMELKDSEDKKMEDMKEETKVKEQNKDVAPAEEVNSEEAIAQRILKGEEENARAMDIALQLTDTESEMDHVKKDHPSEKKPPQVEEAVEVGAIDFSSDKHDTADEASRLCGLEKIVVDESNLAEYAGNPVFQNEKLYEQTPVGVVMGLAWTALGGSTLYVEASLIEQGKEKGSMNLTGQLGDVMKESASIALTLSRKILRHKDPSNDFFSVSRIHVHVPAGATPKDGPSAGCTMVTSMLSLAMDQPVVPDLAMTGEVTLTGRILPIGGVKEKTIASRRCGVKTILFPKANKKDFDELPEHVKEGLDVRFVETYDAIFELAFAKTDHSN